MDPVQDRGSMDPVHESGPWTRSKVGVHGPLVHVLSSPRKKSLIVEVKSQYCCVFESFKSYCSRVSKNAWTFS